jgi:hypothetical protein
MGFGKYIAAGAALTALAGCQAIPSTMSVADYCAQPKKMDENVCRLNVEIDGTKTAITETNMRVGEARRLAGNAQASADAAQAAANRAQQDANRAQGTADGAMSAAQQALSMRENMQCVTRTLNKTDTGTCEPGYTVMSCQQTRYTYSAGGMSIMRQINDEECKYNTRVLEMQVRCCRVSPGTAQRNVNQVVPNTSPAPVRRSEPRTTSPLRY